MKDSNANSQADKKPVILQSYSLSPSNDKNLTEEYRVEETHAALLNILEDFNSEKNNIEKMQRATFNILEDFYEEKFKLEDMQRAILNILDDLNYSNEELQKARDILEVRVAERTAELAKSNAEVLSLARFPSEDPNPIFRINNKLKIIYSNKPARELLKKIGFKSFSKSLTNTLAPFVRKEKEDDLITLELDIDKSIYEFSIIQIKGAGYFNIYARDITERKKAEKTKIKLLHDRIQSKEKKRLAEELHDTVTQTLFGSNLLSEAVSKSWEKNPQEALENLKKVRDLNRAAFLEARTLLYELVPKKIAQESLADLIKSLVDAVTLKFDIKFDVKFLGNYKLSYKVKHQIYRIVQESINNIVKHSKASQVQIDCSLDPKELKVVISDNGIGFDKKDSSFKKNFGLNIMNERAAAIGARLYITSIVGSGTRITLLKN
jgi:signal transduction histidine kinase